MAAKPHVVRGCYECPLNNDELPEQCEHPEAPPGLMARGLSEDPPPPECPLRAADFRLHLTLSDDLRVGEREASQQHEFGDVVARDMALGLLPGVRATAPTEHDRLTRAERALAVLLRTSGARIPLQSNEKAILREFLEGLGR